MDGVLSEQADHKITPSLLTLLYAEKGWTLLQIADHLGCSQQTVLNHMRKHGIKRRHRMAHFQGRPHPCVGRNLSPEHIQKIREASVRRGATPPHRSGAAHWNWQGGIAYIHDRGRHKRKLREWRLSVFERDAYACQGCGQVGRQLNAHHIKAWSKYPALRFVLDNGVTLCVECHRFTHKSQHGLGGSHA